MMMIGPPLLSSPTPRDSSFSVLSPKITCFRPEEKTKPDMVRIYPFWEKKNKSYPQRLLNKRIIQLTKRRQLSQIFEEVENAEKENLMPNRSVMNSVMAAAVHCHNLDQAFLVFKKMLESCGVDNVSHTILLKGLGEAGRLDEAFEMLESIQKGTAPGEPTMTEVHLRTLLNAFADAGELRRARGILVHYKSFISSMESSIFTYNILIKANANSDTPMEALKLKDELTNRGIKLQRITFNSLILASVRGGDLEKAQDLLREMKEEATKSQSTSLLPDIITYTTLIKGLGHNGDLNGIVNMVDELRASPNCVIDRVAYGVIIDACIAAGSPAAALAFYEEMVEAAKEHPKLRPKPHVFLSLMRALAKEGDLQMVKLLHEHMVPRSSGPVSAENRKEADELLIEAAITASEFTLARKLLKGMVALKKGIPLSDRAHMAIVRLFVLTDFCDNLFTPYILHGQISLEAPVEEIMLTYDEIKPLPSHLRLSEVVMRFFRDAVVPVVDKSRKCVGFVHREDCFELNARLSDIVREPVATIRRNTRLFEALSLLVELQLEMLVIAEKNINYGLEPDFSEQTVGFLTREHVLTRSTRQ